MIRRASLLFAVPGHAAPRHAASRHAASRLATSGLAAPGVAVLRLAVSGLAVLRLAVSSLAVSSLAMSGLAVAASVPARAAADELDAVLQSLAARRHAEARFVELQYLSILKKPLESSGELVYDAPDRLQMRTLEPHAENLELKGTLLTAQRGRTRRVLDLQSYPEVLPFVVSVRATLAGDRAALEQAFRLQFSGDLSHWTLALVPLDAGLAMKLAEVRIDGARDDVLQVDVRRVDGGRSLLTLQAAAGR